jgi:hypothetical protein
VPAPAIQPAALQQPPRPEGPFPAFPLGDDSPRYAIQLEPPGTQRLFRLESEAQLQQRMRQEARERVPPERISFPEEPVVSKDRYMGRQWPPTPCIAEPNYVCHRRLLFEQRNAERYGWDYGLAQVFISPGVFFLDGILLPYNAGRYPLRKFECSAGLCLPGDPVPLMLYPPELTLTGLATQAAVVGALLAIFP